MADLEFSKNVPGVPAGQQLPNAYRRQANVEETSIPNFQAQMTDYAEGTNWLSSIGSTVASRASNAIAQQIGGELGKNPKGNLGPTLTDFDKTMQESYSTQAQATLSLQANKLITDSNIETAKANRITPELIQKSNDNITSGLRNILKNAPDAVKPHMELQFGNAMLDQNASLSSRMLREQKEDQKNNTAYASDMNAQHAYSFGLNGNDKAGLAAVENTRRLNEASVASRLITPETAKTNIDAARQSYLSGKQINQYEKARAEGKGEEYLKSIADKKPSYLSDNDYMSVTNNLMQYVNHQDALRGQKQQLLMTQAQVNLAKNGALNSSEIMNLKDNLTSNQFAEMQMKIISSHNKSITDGIKVNDVISNWDKPDIYSKGSEQHISSAFNKLVDNLVQSPTNVMTRPEAEMQVAIRAAGPVPQYVKSLNLKGSSNNPQQLEEFGTSIEKIYDAGKGQNISKVDPQAIANYEKYSVLKNNGMLPVEAAQQAHEIVYGKSLEQKKTNDENWIDYVKTNKSSGTTDQQFFLEQAGLQENTFVRNGQAYANQMRTTYESYFKMLNGDATTAQKMLKRSIDQNYGYTSINGVKEYTYAPINKLLNLSDDSDGVIHVDIANQINKQLASTNQAYKDGRSDWRWEVKPQITIEEALSHENISKEFSKSALAKEGLVERNINRFNNQNKVELHKIYRDGRIEKYNAIIQANPYASRTLDANVPLLGGWDIMLASDKGMSTIHSLDPQVGTISYRPDVESIKANYKKLHHVKYGM